MGVQHMKNRGHYVAKFLALPICVGIVFSIVVSILQGEEILGPYLIPGFILTMIVGWPTLALIEWKFYRCRWRYVLGGLLCAFLIWLPFFVGSFFIEVSPGRGEEGLITLVLVMFFIFSFLVGLVGGIFYTFIVAAINRILPLQE